MKLTNTWERVLRHLVHLGYFDLFDHRKKDKDVIEQLVNLKIVHEIDHDKIQRSHRYCLTLNSVSTANISKGNT